MNPAVISRGGRRPGVHRQFPLPQPQQLLGGGGGGDGGAGGVPAGVGGEQGRGAGGVQQAVREPGLHHCEVQQPGQVPLHQPGRDCQYHHQASNDVVKTNTTSIIDLTDSVFSAKSPNNKVYYRFCCFVNTI